jgi:peptide/nickel transport system substrate-binding protein
MTHIIDRKAIVQYLLEGIGQEITGPFYVFSPANDRNITPWPCDTKKAVLLLEQAGWTDTNGDGLRDKQGRPLTFRFMYPASYALYERFARLLKDNAARIGVEVLLEPCEWSILSARLNNRQFDAYIAGWSPDTAEDAFKLFHSSQITGGCNYVGFADPEADALMDQARRTMEDDKRNQLYRRLHKILHDVQPCTFLFTRPTLRLIDRRFENVTIHKLGLDYLEWYVPVAKQRYK